MISKITLKITANANTVFTDSLSVPKIIGVGPIMITPAPLISPFFAPFTDTPRITATTTKTPTTISTVPMM